MHKPIVLLLAILSLNVSAEALLTDRIEKSQRIDDTVGTLRFVLHNLEGQPYSLKTNRAEIEISTLDGQFIQRIPVQISFPRPSLELVDLNDDGHVDLLLYSSDIPNGSIPLPEAYLYVPKLKRFIKSITLSGRGELLKSKRRGCVNVTFERNINGYITEEWCFKLETGKWKMRSSEQVELGAD